MESVLKMLKIDLGINHSLRDEYFKTQIEATKTELSSRGVKLNCEEVEDIMLLCDFVAWRYRKRTEDVRMPQNLIIRIRNKQVKGRANIV